jgi:hypothetical protein
MKVAGRSCFWHHQLLGGGDQRGAMAGAALSRSNSLRPVAGKRHRDLEFGVIAPARVTASAHAWSNIAWLWPLK